MPNMPEALRPFKITLPSSLVAKHYGAPKAGEAGSFIVKKSATTEVVYGAKHKFTVVDTGDQPYQYKVRDGVRGRTLMRSNRLSSFFPIEPHLFTVWDVLRGTDNGGLEMIYSGVEISLRSAIGLSQSSDGPKKDKKTGKIQFESSLPKSIMTRYFIGHFDEEGNFLDEDGNIQYSKDYKFILKSDKNDLNQCEIFDRKGNFHGKITFISLFSHDDIDDIMEKVHAAFVRDIDSVQGFSTAFNDSLRSALMLNVK